MAGQVGQYVFAGFGHSDAPSHTEFAFLSRPGQRDIQTDLFYDYRTNVASYPAWQDWLRQHQPPLLVLWGFLGRPTRE